MNPVTAYSTERPRRKPTPLRDWLADRCRRRRHADGWLLACGCGPGTAQPVYAGRHAAGMADMAAGPYPYRQQPPAGPP